MCFARCVVDLTEGLLRLLDRKTEGKFCDPSQGVKRSFNRADSSPVVPGQNMEIELPFLPVAALVKSGHHIRLSLAGADAGNFPTLTGDNSALWTVSYGGANSSRLSLPLKPWVVE